MDLNSLPAELFLHIFSYLDSDDLCQLTGQVCQMWQIFSHDRILWQTVQLDESVRSSNEIIRIVKNSSLAHSFLFSNITDWKFLSFLPKRHRVRRVEFDVCNRDEFCVSKLVTSLPSVEYVRLRTTDIDCDVIRRIAEWVFLKDFTINLCVCGEKLNLDGSNCLYILAEKCEYLENLDMGYHLCVDDRSLLTFAKSRGVNLKTFTVSFGISVSANGYKFLTYCPNITGLTMLMPLYMTGTGLLYLKELKSLESCDIRTSFAKAQNFVDLFQGQMYLNLLHLSFDTCKGLNDLVVELMCKSCPSLKKLLIINSANVTDDGILFVVTNSKNIENLTLGLNISGTCLLDISNKMPNLVHLNVISCFKITTETLNELKSNNRSIIIHN